MSEQYQVFDAAKLELEKGINLVEASAGTGKTYAIGMLVLRAVVELRIPIDKILIVTFTKAATEELRSRIRKKLSEALELLRGEHPDHVSGYDETLESWKARVEDHQDAIIRLQAALYEIDCAAIYTIHGYCQRMLVEQALESNQLFEVELSSTVEHERQQLVDDYWRKHLYNMDPLACSVITAAFPTPQSLLASVSLAKTGVGAIVPPVSSLETEVQTLLHSMEEMQQWWQGNCQELQERFFRAIEGKYFKKRVSADFEEWFGEIDAYFCGTSYALPSQLELLTANILQAELNGKKIKGEENRHQFLQQWNLPGKALFSFQEAAEKLLLTFRVILAEKLCREVSKRLVGKGIMGFDDLIHNLDQALDQARNPSFEKTLAGRFGMALIDEFQDTDSTQYRIFRTVFGQGNHYLYLIGDPKQAIYKFRGADIHSYFQAKREADSLLTLEKNYRSHPNLVGEVNRLFGSRSEPFYYDTDVLGYNLVKAAKSDKELGLAQNGQDAAGMVYCSLAPAEDSKDGRWSGSKAKDLLRSYVTREIGELLTSPPVITEGEKSWALSLKDIAVLVRKNREAEEYRNSLALAGIPAVVMSRASVFHTTECRELLSLLAGISSSSEVAAVKTAMTISWFGRTGNELYQLWQDEIHLSLWQAKMADYRGMWQHENFLTMMSRLLLKEELFVNIARHPLAERKIANILQLIELIQEQESRANYGIVQTLRWLEKMYMDEKVSDEGELLLESDADAVQIVTMHSAKGLEYPVVFCPLLWSGSDFLGAEKHQVADHDSGGRVVVDLGSEIFGQRKQESIREQAAEDLRLLYVALTRAKLRCYTMWADVKKYGPSKDAFDSALGYLLFPDGYCPENMQEEMFGQLAEKFPVEYRRIPYLQELEELGVEGKYLRKQVRTELKPRPSSDRSLHTDYQMSSFSALATFSPSSELTALSGHQHETGKSVPENPGEMGDTPTDASSLPPSDIQIGVLGLPTGPVFGNVVHDLLEELVFCDLAKGDGLSAACEKTTKRYGIAIEDQDLARLLGNVVNTILPPGFSLSELEETKCLKEMEFYFRLNPINTDEINAILAEEATVQPLGHREMQGYLTGFVDLICEIDGKYYIFDYKTNYLGDLMENYRPQALVSAMAEHNYGLQYWIYTLVLHRHLKNLLPDYNYNHHFGGVMYLFVRGMSPDEPGYGVFSALPDEEKLDDLNRLIGGYRR